MACILFWLELYVHSFLFFPLPQTMTRQILTSNNPCKRESIEKLIDNNRRNKNRTQKKTNKK